MPRDLYHRKAGAGIASVTPNFRLFNGTAFNGVDQLPSALTINGTTVYPDIKYQLGDATATELPASSNYGETLVIDGLGDAPSINQGSPLMGPNDGSVKFNHGTRYTATDSSVGDPDTKDIVLEIVFKLDDTQNKFVVTKKGAFGNGWRILQSFNTFYFQTLLGSSITTSTAALDNDTWYHGIIFLDRSGSAQWYVNGVVSGSPDVISGSAGSLTNTSMFTVGGTGSDPANTYSGNIALVQVWQSEDWLDTHLQASVAKERFMRLTGFWPSGNITTKAPVVATRSAPAYIDKLEDNGTTRKLYQVGDHWMRVVSRLDENGDEIQGYLSELQARNRFLQSEDLDTSWAKRDAGDTIGGSVETPNKSISTTAGIIGDATDGPHGVTQAVTLTSALYTFSVFAKKGDQDYLLLGNQTIANDLAWFNLNTGAIGTEEAGVTATMEDWGDGWYRCAVTFIGTAAAHTLEVRGADNDNDMGYVGDGSTINIYAWGAQVESRDFMTSYIFTSTAAITKGRDNLYYKGDDGGVTDGIGTFVFKGLSPDADLTTDHYYLTLNDGGSSTNSIAMSLSASGTDNPNIHITSTESGTAYDFSATPENNVTNNVITEHRVLWGTDFFAYYKDDSLRDEVTPTATPPNDIDRITIGESEFAIKQGTDVIISDFRIYSSQITP